MNRDAYSSQAKLFALVDCNNFYASCERVFNPALNNRPIVVLSNNDGCIVSRSAEAKALGIPMGAPYFKYKDIILKNNVAVFSSNYELYGDMSRRVMNSLRLFAADIEVYSIDEAFLKFFNYNACDENLMSICKTIKQWTHIPISIGVAPTKTLAKIANKVAKQQMTTGVFNGGDLNRMKCIMKDLPIEEIWGISKGWGKQLRALGITTALQLSEADQYYIRKVFNVVLERIVLELRGIPCLELEDIRTRKSICSSKSFGTLLTELPPIEEALATYAARACEKMRAQHSYTQHVGVMLKTSRFKEKEAYYGAYYAVNLPQPTDDTAVIIKAAKWALKKIFKAGYSYQKTGIILLNLLDKTHSPQFLFYKPETLNQLKTKENLMTCLDQINKRYGKHTLFYGAQGTKRPWSMRCDKRSPRYTTKFSEIPRVR